MPTSRTSDVSRLTRTGFYFTLFLIAGLTVTCCSTRDPKFSQYLVEGEQLYRTHCSNCHQANGKGLGLVYPPLGPSDFMDRNLDKVLCAIKYGMTGEIIVNGMSYNQPMPGIPTLTELEVAEIATYIYNSWGHEKGLIEVRDLPEVLAGCKRD